MNSNNIDKEFKAGHVGQLTKRHEELAQSRAEQQAIPYEGPTYAEQQLAKRNQQGDGGTK